MGRDVALLTLKAWLGKSEKRNKSWFNILKPERYGKVQTQNPNFQMWTITIGFDSIASYSNYPSEFCIFHWELLYSYDICDACTWSGESKETTKGELWPLLTGRKIHEHVIRPLFLPLMWGWVPLPCVC